MLKHKANFTHYQHAGIAHGSTLTHTKPELFTDCALERVARWHQFPPTAHRTPQQKCHRNEFLARQCAIMALLLVQPLPFMCELFLTCSSSPSAPSTACGEKRPKTPANRCWERFPDSFLSPLHPHQGKDLAKQRPWRGPWGTVSCPGALLILHTGTGRNMEWAHPGFFSLHRGTVCSPRRLWEEENKG